MLLPKQAVSFAQLRSDGLDKWEILGLCAGLRLFPTPFKGIYYVPVEEERKGEFIEKPLKVLSQAVALFLGNKEFYFTCRTAEEALGLNWQPSGTVHIANSKLSRRINLKVRIDKSSAKSTWRARKVSRLLSFYGSEIVFHKGEVYGAKTKQTPYGRFALRSQIKKDRERFGEKSHD
ncbi:hypothetical protein HY570_03630 [Candidatus Micrarchaeota archaeon]|nr:hypothetical protein [Candidatus Micrarchaeota archaeon]